MAGSNARNREEVVFTIVSLLVTEKPSYNIPIPKLESLYRSTESERIPYKLLGYPSIVEFLRTIPQIQLVVRDGTHFINFLGSEKTRELTDLVVKQKTSQKCQRSRSTTRTKGPRGVPSGYFSRSQSALPPRMSDNFLRLCSETLEILEKSPIKLTKTILMYKVREKKPGYFDMQTLNDVLHSLGGKVIIDDQMVSAASKVGRQHEISWDSNQQEPPPPKNPVIVRNAQVEEEDESGIDDYGDYDNNQVTVKNDKLVAAISAGQEAPQITQRDARGNEENLGVNDPRTQAEVEMIINERMRFRLEKLIQNCPGGIWCSELAKMYYEKYNLNLEWQQLGFNSLSDLVLHLPDIFYCVQPSPTADFRVFDAKNRDKGEAVMPVKLTLSAIHRIYPDPEDEVRAIPARLSPETGNRLIPEDAVPLGESVGQVLIDSFNQEDKGYEEIVVCDAFTPSFFWIHLRRKIYKHTSMMDEMQVFYDQKASSYGVPLILLEKGLNVVCKFYGKWHRGIVKNIEPDAESTTAILFYDYGTLHKYPANEIYFLHRIFSNLPAQAIPCGLYNIKPPEDYEALRNPDGKVRWSIDTSRRFVQRVHDRPLVAICGKKFYENNSMLLSLTDTSSDEDVNIGEWLVNDGLAVYGSMVRIRPKNFPYKQSLTCKAPQPYKKSRKAIKKLISIVKTSPPSDVSKLSNTRGSISKVESLRTKFLEKKPAKSAATCPTCGHAIVNLPDPKIEQVPDIPRVNGVVSPVEAEVMPQVGKLYDEVPRLHGTAMQMIGHWVETGYMPGIAIPPARESSDEWMERGLTADDIPVQSNRSADQIEIPLKFDEKTQTPEEIFVEAPYTPENETVVSIEVGMKPLHLLPPVTIDVDDTVSEFETVMKPQRQVLQSGIIDWETFTIIDTNSEPKPVEKGELFKIIPKPKRKIVATDELLDDASWGGGAAEWEEELGEIKQEMILPIINQALRNNKKELKYSRVVVRRDIPGERHTSNGLGQSSETSGVPITELKKTEEKRSGGEEPSEPSPSVAVNNSVANEEYAELDGVLQSLDVQPSSLNAVNGGLPGEETRINEEAGANGDLEDNEKTIEFSPLLETTPGMTEGLSPTILIEEIPSSERELDDTIIQDNLEEVNYSLDTETPRQQRVLIEELSFSEDSEGVDMVSVYAEMLKKSPRFLKQILEPHSTEECSDLDSDDESREIFNDKESIDKSIEKIEIIDQDDVPGTVEPTEKNNNEIIPTESIDNSLTSKLKSKYSDGESLEDNSRLELINNEKNQLTNGISGDYTYIPIYDSSDFSSDDEEFDVYLAGEDKFYGLSPDIGRLREITINGTYVKDISNEENCKLLSLKSSDEIKRDEDDDDVEEVYRSPEETDDSLVSVSTLSD